MSLQQTLNKEFLDKHAKIINMAISKEAKNEIELTLLRNSRDLYKPVQTENGTVILLDHFVTKFKNNGLINK